MKLWIDDIRNAPDETWTVARTCLSAIRAISQFDFTQISLDHDISHQVAVGALSRPYPCEETFESVARYIAVKYELSNTAVQGQTELTHGWKPEITIHSSNPVGARKMQDILADAGITSIFVRSVAANRLEMEV